MPVETAHHDVRHRGMLTACAILATVLQLLDQTIANVALPYMQGSFSASFDEITWVLTSYITASAIMTAPVGWLAARYGRKPLYVICTIGFTATSMLCGAAQSLGQMVVFRILQGVFGAALVPLSQATLLDIYPVKRRGRYGDLGRRCDARANNGPNGRRLVDRDVQLALGVLHKPALRSASRRRSDDLPAGRWRAGTFTVRLAGLHRAHDWYWRLAVDAGSRP